MNFSEAVTSVFQNYFNFQSRARRSEYWYFVLFLMLAGIIAGIVDQFALGYAVEEIGLVSGLFSLATIIPGLSVAVRRMHDLDRSGWFLLLTLIPIVGVIVLIYWFCQPGTSGKNRFGDNPV